MITIEEVESFCKDLKIGLMDVNIELDGDEVRISMRDDADDEPCQTTFIAARATTNAIREKFGDEVKLRSEVIDEWIDVTIKLK